MRSPRKTTPLEFILGVMRDPEQKMAVRLRAAALALPFVHIKLTAAAIAAKKPAKPIGKSARRPRLVVSNPVRPRP